MLVFVVNAGSSTLKYQLIDMSNEQVVAKGNAERIGSGGVLTHQTTGKDKVRTEADIPDHTVAMRLVFDALTDPTTGAIKVVSEITAIGHRVVHGGESFSKSVKIDQTVIDTVAKLSELAPLHNPPNLMGIDAAMKLMPRRRGGGQAAPTPAGGVPSGGF